MPITGKYGTAVSEVWRVIPKRDFFSPNDVATPDLDHWAYYNLPVLGIDALTAGTRAGGTLGSCRIEHPTRD